MRDWFMSAGKALTKISSRHPAWYASDLAINFKLNAGPGSILNLPNNLSTPPKKRM